MGKPTRTGPRASWRRLCYRSLRICACCAAVLAVVVDAPAWAQWVPDGFPVCELGGDQRQPVAVPDGSGGIIIVWLDGRSPANPLIYAQRLDVSGVPQWTTNGVPASVTIQATGWAPAAVSDGAGGVIVAWTHAIPGGFEVWAQRIGSGGAPMWGIGTLLSPTANPRTPVIVSDGRSDQVEPPGAIVAWRGGPTTFNEIRAQAVSGSGVVRWASDGVLVSSLDDELYGLAIVTDGTALPQQGPKGAIVSWTDTHLGNVGDVRVFSQRLDASGVPQWAANGIEVGPGIDYLKWPASNYLGAGNAIVAWDVEFVGGGDIHMQRVGASGPWQPAPVPVCGASGEQRGVTTISDVFGGALLAWEDSRSAVGASDVYAQGVSPSGAAAWTPNGVALCTAPGKQHSIQLVPDLNGGAVAIWADERNGAQPDLYARHVDAFGTVHWASDGVRVCGATGSQVLPSAVGDFAGGAIVAWQDDRDGNLDIYAQRVTVNGGVVGVESGRVERFRLWAPSPNPADGAVTLSFEIAEPAPVSASILDVGGRLVRTLFTDLRHGAGMHAIRWDGVRDSGEPAQPGVYFARVRAGDVGTGKIILIR